MQDLETKSLWSQPTGECIQGKMEGKVLNLYPALHTNYAAFKNSFPKGVLLRKEERGEPGSPYAPYFANKEKLGLFGRLDDFERLPGKTLVAGVRLGDKEVAVSMAYLKKYRFVTVDDRNLKVQIRYDATSQTVSAIDVTNSLLSEPPTFPVITAYWFAWISFFPETELITFSDEAGAD